MTKDALRERAKARLADLPADERASASRDIADRVLGVPEVAGARILLLYASLSSEVATDAIASAARERGAVVTYPRCLVETREMVLHQVESPDSLLADGSYGIREPGTECPIVRLEEIEVALVPGLAWDRRGHRLGRGAGYYDRLFARPDWRGLRIGLFFAAQEVPSIPVDPWDAPLDTVVTEHEVWRGG